MSSWESSQASYTHRLNKLNSLNFECCLSWLQIVLSLKKENLLYCNDALDADPTEVQPYFTLLEHPCRPVFISCIPHRLSSCDRFLFSLFICSCYLQIFSFALILLLLLKISFLCYHHNELLWSPPKNAEGHMVWPSFWEVLGQSLAILC